MSLEKRIVQMLSCDSNQPVLEQVVNRDCDVEFRYVASEFPILTENGYGFLDIVGKDEKQNSIVLLECKPDDSLLTKAVEEVEYYKKCLDAYGLFQSEDLIGLYHRAIFPEIFNSKIVFDVKPLILDESKLLRHSGLSFPELLSRYRAFMLEWISRSYGVSSQSIERAISKDTVPIYLVDLLENDERKSHVGFHGLNQPLSFAELETSTVKAPLKLEPDQTNYETLHRIESAKSSANRFSIQFHRHGHSRPMLFFEIDDEYSACFLHTGRHQVELIGYYESAFVLAKTKRIYGLIEAEAGRYTVGEQKGNRITLELEGKQCKGEIKLNFLDRIYLDDDITLASTRQTTLENY